MKRQKLIKAVAIVICILLVVVLLLSSILPLLARYQ